MLGYLNIVTCSQKLNREGIQHNVGLSLLEHLYVGSRLILESLEIDSRIDIRFNM
jgi:hypothetical protein